MRRALRPGSWMIALAAAALLVPGCLRPRGSSPEAKRAYTNEMRQEALSELYQRDPKLEARVKSAAGYAVFSNLSGGVMMLSTGQGYGVAHDNRSGRDTYMRMGELGAGMGMGFKHFRAVYVFHDASRFQRFVDQGFEFGADVDAAVMAGGEGAAGGATGAVVGGGAAAGGSGSAGMGGSGSGGTGSSSTGIEIYQLTESGLMLRGGVAGTKYWKDSELN